jgi:maltooligosyltrehalose trehalohydrolase
MGPEGAVEPKLMMTTGELLARNKPEMDNSIYRIPAMPPCASQEFPLGVTRLSATDWQFVVWAPHAKKVEVHITSDGSHLVPLQGDLFGYHSGRIAGLEPGVRYLFRLDDRRELPDPASRFQPEGVHGPSQLVDLADFRWGDDGWTPPDLEKSVFYELHVGTFTPDGTFDAVIAHLDGLKRLGVTTIELMPIAQFPGARNWGYDGTYVYAVQNSYGGPEGLHRLVNAAHKHGLAVALDVVYNHLGPEGNYLGEFGPYFTDHYRTPWGQAINFDRAESDHVRRFFIENAIFWLSRYHIDALRLDAIHGMFDSSAHHFLAELHEGVQGMARRTNRKIHVIAESDLNDAGVLHEESQGGCALEAQWSDDLHHSLHTLLTGERQGYYEDFGTVDHLATSLRDGWLYSGQYSKFRRRRHGNSPRGLAGSRFVVFSQNHDQVGNRACGERLSKLVNLEELKLAAGVVLLSPFVPLLFMGEEYGETAPFQYFTSHGDPELAEAVRNGRRREFSEFGWQGEIPDPQSSATFEHSKLNHLLKGIEPHRTLFQFYQELIRLRGELDLGSVWERTITRSNHQPVITMIQHKERSNALTLAFYFGRQPQSVSLSLPAGTWTVLLNSADEHWLGAISPNPQKIEAEISPTSLELQPRSFIVLEHAGSHNE